MSIKEALNRKLLPMTAGAAVVALAAGGVAYASTPSAAPVPAAAATTASTASAHLGRVGLRADVARLIRHTIHAQLIVHTKKGFETIDIDKGKLTTDSSTAITIERADKASVSATITSSTKFIGLKESELGSGDGVVLVQHGGYALYVAARAPNTSSNSTSPTKLS